MFWKPHKNTKFLRISWENNTVSLFDWGFSSHSRIFNSYGDLIITCEGLKILTHALHSWHMSSEGSLTFSIYRNTGHLLIWSSPRTLDTHTYCRALMFYSFSYLIFKRNFRARCLISRKQSNQKANLRKNVIF